MQIGRIIKAMSEHPFRFIMKMIHGRNAFRMILHRSAPHRPAKCPSFIRMRVHTFGPSSRRGRVTDAKHAKTDNWIDVNQMANSRHSRSSSCSENCRFVSPSPAEIRVNALIRARQYISVDVGIQPASESGYAYAHLTGYGEPLCFCGHTRRQFWRRWYR